MYMYTLSLSLSRTHTHRYRGPRVEEVVPLPRSTDIEQSPTIRDTKSQ